MLRFLFVSLVLAQQANAITRPCGIRLSQDTLQARTATTWSPNDPTFTIQTPRLRLEVDAVSTTRKNARIYTTEGNLIGEFPLKWDSANTASIRVGPISEPRQGYATEARYFLTKYIYDNFPITEMTETIQSDNTASIALHKKIGFVKKEGSINLWSQKAEDFRSIEKQVNEDPDFARTFFRARSVPN